MLVASIITVLGAPAAHAADPYRPQQYALDAVGAEQAWERSVGRGVVIAVIDSGVDLRHPDLADRLLRKDGRVVGLDFVDDDGDPQDRFGHGTLVAGVAAASRDNGEGIAGVAPRALIMPLRVLDDEGAGSLSDIDAAIRWAVDNGADVINLSLEGSLGDDIGGAPIVSAPIQAVDYAWRNGVVVVAAAGNDGDSFNDYPPTSPVLLVGATDRRDERAAFSDSGRTDGVMAPGVDIVSTWCRTGSDSPCDGNTHTYGTADGTSFAAPHVSAGVALLLAMGLTPQQAVETIRDTARDLEAPGPDASTGRGLIDLDAATRSAAEQLAAAEPSPTPTSSPAPTSSPSQTTSSNSTPTTPTPEPSSEPGPSASPSSSPTTPSTPSSPAPTATDDPAPAETPAPSAAPSGGEAPEVTAPTTNGTPSSPPPVAAGDGGRTSERELLQWLALVLVLVTSAAVATAWPRED